MSLNPNISIIFEKLITKTKVSPLKAMAKSHIYDDLKIILM